MLADILGADLDAAVLTSAADKEGARCQQDVIRGTGKCIRARIQEFHRCAKTGLKDGSITAGPALAECIEKDPRGRIAKACDPVVGRLATKTLAKICVAKGVDLAEAFPRCDTGDAAELATCLDAAARRRVCLALNQADALERDCGLDPFLSRAFVTSQAYTAALGGLSGADDTCQMHAEDAGLPGTFVAWLSTTSIDAKDRLGNDGGWARTDGLPFATSISALLGGGVLHPLWLDEWGNEVTIGTRVFTATFRGGAFQVESDCNAWSAITPDSAVTGQVDFSGNSWSNRGRNACQAALPLYCLQIDGGGARTGGHPRRADCIPRRGIQFPARKSRRAGRAVSVRRDGRGTLRHVQGPRRHRRCERGVPLLDVRRTLGPRRWRHPQRDRRGPVRHRAAPGRDRRGGRGRILRELSGRQRCGRPDHPGHRGDDLQQLDEHEWLRLRRRQQQRHDRPYRSGAHGVRRRRRIGAVQRNHLSLVLPGGVERSRSAERTDHSIAGARR